MGARCPGGHALRVVGLSVGSAKKGGLTADGLGAGGRDESLTPVTAADGAHLPRLDKHAPLGKLRACAPP